jgi:hypothetical protein
MTADKRHHTITRPDLAAIVARDAAYAPKLGNDWQDPTAVVDRHDLLALLRETRDELESVGECHGCIYFGNPDAKALLAELAALDPEPTA